MNFAIITSVDCPAGNNIKSSLLNLFEFKPSGTFDAQPVHAYKDNIKLYTIKQKHIFAENLDKRIDADIFIFATTHRSEKGVHSLSCHTPGNWGKAPLGGKDNTLCISPAILLKKAYLELKNNQHFVPTHEITLECTHHGPFLEKPAMFIEIGSTEEHWGNTLAGEIIARTIIKIIIEKDPENQKIAFGIGGPHYCNNFNKILDRSNIAIGHVCPKYALESLDEGMLKQALEKTNEKVNLILLDWKGLGSHKSRIKEIIEKTNIEILRTDKV